MIINIKDIDVNYIQYGKGSDIILLHGWGQNIEMMKPLGDKLEKDYRITIVDLPGYGKSEEPKTEWTIYDYCDVIEELIKELKIKNPIVMGHSFGGRVAIIYASRESVKKLVLFGTPCIRKEEKLNVKVKLLKTLKKVPILKNFEEFAKKHMGSTDYRNATPIMRKILVNTVNEDLSQCAKKIKCPTLLIWGDMDEAVSLDEARELEKLIMDSGLVVYESGTHYTYLEFLNPIIGVLKSFFREE